MQGKCTRLPEAVPLFSGFKIVFFYQKMFYFHVNIWNFSHNRCLFYHKKEATWISWNTLYKLIYYCKKSEHSSSLLHWAFFVELWQKFGCFINNILLSPTYQEMHQQKFKQGNKRDRRRWRWQSWKPSRQWGKLDRYWGIYVSYVCFLVKRNKLVFYYQKMTSFALLVWNTGERTQSFSNKLIITIFSS